MLITSPHIPVEFLDLFRQRHPAQIHRREIQSCNDIGATEPRPYRKLLDNRPQAHILAEELGKDGRATLTAVAITTIEGFVKLVIWILGTILPPTCHFAIGEAVGFSQQSGPTAIFFSLPPIAEIRFCLCSASEPDYKLIKRAIYRFP